MVVHARQGRTDLPLTGAEPLVVEAPLILWFGLS
jgi:hypothetical protein